MASPSAPRADAAKVSAPPSPASPALSRSQSAASVSSPVAFSEQSPPPEYTPSAVPLDRLLGCARAHARLLDLVSRVDDAVARRPSLLPGWTVGHLITHLARNGDSHTGMLGAAQNGQAADQYPGGQAQREGDIVAGADRAAHLLSTDLAESVRRLEHAWDSTHVDIWRGGLGRTVTLGAVSLADLVFLRWREVEIHLVD
ncbi:maleylpyruvate isomerase N-terminal domain-containing protein, partial [Frankia sp. EI5c]|uniref:maleylpyruvate isomerase N-terminal domain-containing protein n=1 Tax=Frankia sp. EI5c TaxID=683316 RepID=UPI001F5B8941